MQTTRQPVTAPPENTQPTPFVKTQAKTVASLIHAHAIYDICLFLLGRVDVMRTPYSLEILFVEFSMSSSEFQCSLLLL